MRNFATNFCLLLLTPLFVGCVAASKYESLEKDYGALKTDNESSKTKITELEALIAELERKLGQSTTDKASMKESIEQMKSALAEASARKKETEKRIAEYKKLVQTFQKLTQAGELSIKIVDGRMVVALPSDVLFKSGSAKLSPKGEETIKQVSQLLVKIENKKFQVEGHTDNVPIKTSNYPSNWELASARSVNVLKTMVDAGMPMKRISAASFGETRPFLENNTDEGRKANRRIEVVVVPDLSALPGYDELSKYSGEEAKKTAN